MKAMNSRVGFPGRLIGTPLHYVPDQSSSTHAAKFSVVQQQVQEASLIRDKVYQLEQAHMTIKAK